MGTPVWELGRCYLNDNEGKGSSQEAQGRDQSRGLVVAVWLRVLVKMCMCPQVTDPPVPDIRLLKPNFLGDRSSSCSNKVLLGSGQLPEEGLVSRKTKP